MHHSKAHHQCSTLFCLHLLFFMHLLIFWAKWPWNWKALQMNSQKVETWHGIIIHPHSMCKKAERVTAKTRCTSCTKWIVSFEVSAFRTKIHLLQRHFIFLNLLQLQTFCAFNMHYSKPRHRLSTLFCLHLLFFMHLMICFELNDPKIEKHYKWTLKSWNLAWYHNFPHIACAKKLRGLWEKLDALRVQTGQSLSKY